MGTRMDMEGQDGGPVGGAEAVVDTFNARGMHR
jgi:hypothetical protein